MKISEIFDINQGIQITDEEIYNSTGSIPILTANNEIKGYGKKSIVKKEDLPCLSYPSKAFSGNVFVQEQIFNANNTAILIPKKKYRKEINLKYFALYLGNIFINYLSSESSVNYLGKHILENIDVEYPFLPIDTQNQIVEKYEKLKHYKKILLHLNEEINSIYKNKIILDKYKLFDMEKIALLNKGSNKISEEMIYKNFDKNGIPIYSSATEKEGLMGKITEDFYNKMDKKGNAGELTWTTNGYAGVVFYRKTKYLYSEKCGRIVIRSKYRNVIEPKYLMYQLNTITQSYKTAESNNGKLDIIHMSKIPVIFPVDNKGNISMEKQRAIVEQFEKLANLEVKIKNILLVIENYIRF